MKKSDLTKAWLKFQPSMDGIPFIVSTLVNKESYSKTLVDTGCLSYGLVSQHFALKNNLQRITIPSRKLTSFEAVSTDEVTEVATMSIDIDGHYEEQAFFYVIPRMESYDMILGLPWITKQDVRINAP